jgi:hypothetical protein
MATLKLDAVAKSIGPKQQDGSILHSEAVTFRGWLGAGEGAATNYRLYTSPWGEQWLELKGSDIVHQLPGDTTADGSSVIWVTADAKITKCVAGEAHVFAEQGVADPDDATAARIPKY